MLYGRSLAVNKLLGWHNGGAKALADALVAEADPENRDFPGQGLDNIDAVTSFIGGAGTRRDDQAIGFQGLDFFGGDLIIAFYTLRHPQLAKILDQIVGE